jgi:aminoglycoside/choline kinase family phosphotransferase
MQHVPATAASVPLPRSAADVTPVWLTAALRGAGFAAEVGSFVRQPLGEGIGMMSGLERLDVTYANGTGPAVVVLKMPATNEGNRAVADAFHLYEREVLFYRDVAPRSAAYTPVVYHADIDANDFVLLLEDLSAYELGDQVKGCTLTQTEGGIDWLARHHASLWGRTDDPTLEFLPHVSPSYSSEALTQGCAFGWGPMAELFAHVVPERIALLKDRYLAALPKLFAWMATPPLTVVHGDFRMDNLFFGSAAGQEPLIAIDWQGSLRGRASQDVAYFLSGSLPAELRREHERALIGRWHGGLTAAGVTGYTETDAWDDYRKAVLYVWVIAVVIAGTLDPTNERGRQWISAMLARSVAAIDELDLVTLLDELA